MKTYFNAFVETLLIMLIAGVAAVAVMWLFMVTIHAPHVAVVDAEIVAVVATAIAAVFFFKSVLKTEKRLSREEKENANKTEAP